MCSRRQLRPPGRRRRRPVQPGTMRDAFVATPSARGGACQADRAGSPRVSSERDDYGGRITDRVTAQSAVRATGPLRGVVFPATATQHCRVGSGRVPTP
jgi:hypothetical protein